MTRRRPRTRDRTPGDAPGRPRRAPRMRREEVGSRIRIFERAVDCQVSSGGLSRWPPPPSWARAGVGGRLASRRPIPHPDAPPHPDALPRRGEGAGEAASRFGLGGPVGWAEPREARRGSGRGVSPGIRAARGRRPGAPRPAPRPAMSGPVGLAGLGPPSTLPGISRIEGDTRRGREIAGKVHKSLLTRGDFWSKVKCGSAEYSTGSIQGDIKADRAGRASPSIDPSLLFSSRRRGFVADHPLPPSWPRVVGPSGGPARSRPSSSITKGVSIASASSGLHAH